MTSDHRVTPGLIHDILDALERHGYYRSDDLHADRASTRGCVAVRLAHAEWPTAAPRVIPVRWISHETAL